MTAIHPNLSLLLLTLALSPVLVTGRLIDLSYDLSNATTMHPAHRHLELYSYEVNKTNSEGERYWYKVDEVTLATHSSTHMDAPCHFGPGMRCIDAIPLESLWNRPFAVLDVSAQAALDPDYRATVGDLQAWEKDHGEIPVDGVLLLKTGWHRYWGNTTAYLGADTVADPEAILHYPGLHADAAQWLVDNRRIVGFGIEGMSVDHGPSAIYPAHVILSRENIYMMENINGNIDELEPRTGRISMFPTKFWNASGAPCRVVVDTNAASTQFAVGRALIVSMLAFCLFHC